MNRADLHLTLYDTVKTTVPFRFGREIVSIAQHQDRVDVTLTDCVTESIDIVVGADGVHSKTRTLVFSGPFGRYLGRAYFAFVVPNRTTTPLARPRELVSVKGDGFWIGYGLHSPVSESQGMGRSEGTSFTRRGHSSRLLPPTDART